MTDISKLVETRYNLTMVGHVNKKELRAFVPCCQKSGDRIWEHIKETMKAEGIEKLDGNIILVDRLIKYLGLTKEGVIDAYERTKKG